MSRYTDRWSQASVEEEILWLATFGNDNGFKDVRPLSRRRYTCIIKYIFTHAIIVGDVGDEFTFNDRWCYHDYASAKAALDKWAVNGYQGEPDDWHRHPGTGRRRSETSAVLEHGFVSDDGIGLGYI